jgi:hypothetical protein
VRWNIARRSIRGRCHHVKNVRSCFLQIATVNAGYFGRPEQSSPPPANQIKTDCNARAPLFLRTRERNKWLRNTHVSLSLLRLQCKNPPHCGYTVHTPFGFAARNIHLAAHLTKRNIMPLIDMPLPELLKYEGRNPRPADMEEYWDKALQEMRAIEPNVELVTHALNSSFAECFHLYFTGVGGARVHAKYLRPKNAPQPHPAVVIFHGYSGSSGDWQDKLALVSQGYSVAALDVRGQSGLSQDVGGTMGKDDLRPLYSRHGRRAERPSRETAVPLGLSRLRTTRRHRDEHARSRCDTRRRDRWFTGRCAHSGLRRVGAAH